MAYYKPEDVQAALQSGLITDQDAQYLLDALEPGAPVGGMVGGAIGAAGLGALGGALGGGAGAKLAGNFGKATMGADPGMMRKMGAGIADFAGKPAVGGMDMAGLGAAGLGAGAGGTAGAMSGDMMFPGSPGEGVQGQVGPNGPDKDALLRALMDPSTPPKMKQQIVAMLQEQEGPQEDMGEPGEEGAGGGAPGWAEALGGLAGGALGGYGGYKGGMKAGGAMGGLTGELAGAGLGALGGAGLGAYGGVQGADAAANAMRSPYEDPLA